MNIDKFNSINKVIEYLNNMEKLLKTNKIDYKSLSDRIYILISHPNILDIYIHYKTLHISINDNEINEISNEKIFDFSKFENTKLCRKYKEYGYAPNSICSNRINMWKETDLDNLIHDLDKLTLGNGFMTKNARHKLI